MATWAGKDTSEWKAGLGKRRAELTAAGLNTPQLDQEYFGHMARMDMAERMSAPLPGVGGQSTYGNPMEAGRAAVRGGINAMGDLYQWYDRTNQRAAQDIAFNTPPPGVDPRTFNAPLPSQRTYKPYQPSEMSQAVQASQDINSQYGPLATPYEYQGSMAARVGESLGGMAPGLAATVGAATIPGAQGFLPAMASAAFAGPQMSQQTFEEAQQRGMSPEASQAAATTSGLYSAGSAAVLSRLPVQRLVGGLAGNAERVGLESVRTPASTAMSRAASAFVLGAGEEGGQEASETLVQNAVLGKPLGQGVGDAFGMGALLGGPISAAGAGGGELRLKAVDSKVDAARIQEETAQKQAAQQAEADAAKRAEYDEQLAMVTSPEELQAIIDSNPPELADPIAQQAVQAKMAQLSELAGPLSATEGATGSSLRGAGFAVEPPVGRFMDERIRQEQIDASLRDVPLAQALEEQRQAPTAGQQAARQAEYAASTQDIPPAVREARLRAVLEDPSLDPVLRASIEAEAKRLRAEIDAIPSDTPPAEGAPIDPARGSVPEGAIEAPPVGFDIVQPPPAEIRFEPLPALNEDVGAQSREAAEFQRRVDERIRQQAAEDYAGKQRVGSVMDEEVAARNSQMRTQDRDARRAARAEAVDVGLRAEEGRREGVEEYRKTLEPFHSVHLERLLKTSEDPFEREAIEGILERRAIEDSTKLSKGAAQPEGDLNAASLSVKGAETFKLSGRPTPKAVEPPRSADVEHNALPEESAVAPSAEPPRAPATPTPPEPSPAPSPAAATARPGDARIASGRAALDRSAKARLRDGGKRNDKGGALFAHDALALTDIMVGHMQNGIHDFKTLSAKIVEEFGEWVRPHLRPLYAEAQKSYQQEKAPAAKDAPVPALRAASEKAAQAKKDVAAPASTKSEPVKEIRAEAPAEKSVSMKSGETFKISHGLAGAKDARYVEFKDGKHYYEYKGSDGSWKAESRADEAFARATSGAGEVLKKLKRPSGVDTPPETAEAPKDRKPVRPALWREIIPTLGKKIGSLGKYGKELEEFGLDVEYAAAISAEETGALGDAYKAVQKRKDYKTVHFKYWNAITQKVDFKAERVKWEAAERSATDAAEKAHAKAQVAWLIKAERELGFNPAESTPPDIEEFNKVWRDRSDRYKSAHEAVAGEDAAGRLPNYAPEHPNDDTRLAIGKNDQIAQGLKRRAERLIRASEAGKKMTREQVEAAALDMLTQGDPFTRTKDRVPKPGSLELHRGDLFGPADIDQTFGVTGKWFSDAARAIRAREILGKVGDGGKVEVSPTEGLDNLVRKLDDSLEAPRGIPFDGLAASLRQGQVKEARAYARLVMDLPVEGAPGADSVFQKAAKAAASYQFHTKLLSIAFLARNALQHMTLGPFVLDFTSSVRGVLDQFSAEKRKLNRAAIADHTRTIFEEHSSQPKSAFGRALGALDPLKRAVGAEEAMLRSMSGSGASAYAKMALQVIGTEGDVGTVGKMAQEAWQLGNPLQSLLGGDGAAGVFRRRLHDVFRMTDAEIDEAIAKGGFDKVIDSKDPIKERTLDTRIRHIGAHEINFGFGPNYTHARLVGSGPISTVLRTFQQFGISSAHKVARDAVKEAFAHGNFRPAAVGLLAWAAAGELGNTINEIIAGEKEKKSDYAETWYGRVMLRLGENVSQAGALSLLETIWNGRLPGGIHVSSVKNAEGIKKGIEQIVDGNTGAGFEYLRQFALKEVRAWREASTNWRRASQAMKDSPVRVVDLNRARRIAEIYKESFGAKRDKDFEASRFKAQSDLVRDALVNVHPTMTGDEYDLIQKRVEQAVKFIEGDGADAKKHKTAVNTLEASLLAKGPLGPLSFASDDKKYTPKKAAEFYKWVEKRQRARVGYGDTLTVDQIKAMQAAYDSAVEAALQRYKQAKP